MKGPEKTSLPREGFPGILPKNPRHETKMRQFAHLEVHSAYSFLWGTFEPEDLVREAASLGQEAVALTDYGLHGVPKFYKAAIQAGIQPIVGVRISIWDGSLITLLATDFHGYGNLCRLVSIGLHDGMYPKIPITKQDLKHRSSGLICLAPGKGPQIGSLPAEWGRDALRFRIQELRSLLHSPDRLFLTLENHRTSAGSTDLSPEAAQELKGIVDLAAELNVPTVATNGVAYLGPEDYHVHRALVGIQRRHHHRDVRPLPNDSFHLASGDEMERRIPYPEALDNTEHIAALCGSFSMPVGILHPPSLQAPKEASKRLAVKCLKELNRLHHSVTVDYMRQLDLELQAVNRIELADFFLLVREVVEFARDRGIRHSVRGSAAGSLIVYLLLGGVDPLEHDLLFERFINEGRMDLPDIDVDFDSERRDEIIHHVMERFPRETAMVCTIHSFKARSAVRLAARSLGYSLKEIKRLSTCLPWSLRGRDLGASMERLPELRDSPLQKESRLLELAVRLTGLPFQCSVHLGGVLIAPGDIKDWTPVGRSPKGLPVSQLDKDDAEILGLLKLDLLGLRMHTAIGKSLQVLKDKGVSLELERLPLDDRKTYALLRSTESVGVFQLESPGQRNLLGRLLPRRFSDLIAEISLFRPGPVEGNMVEVYVKRRNNEEPVKIPHPDLAPALRETYGVILFQEQVLRVVHIFAGAPYGEADVFRRAMTKERWSQGMLRLRERFVEGVVANGHDRSLAEAVFEQLALFASYGFCKAHAASFAHITYQSAFLKAHYPQAFYLGLLNAGHVGSYPAFTILNEARRRGIPVYGPHVNSGGLSYQAEGSGIRVPLHVINNVGPAMARRIVADRDRRGPFSNRTDFLARLSLPERIMENLSLAGALHGLEEREWRLGQEACNG